MEEQDIGQKSRPKLWWIWIKQINKDLKELSYNKEAMESWNKLIPRLITKKRQFFLRTPDKEKKIMEHVLEYSNILRPSVTLLAYVGF